MLVSIKAINKLDSGFVLYKGGWHSIHFNNGEDVCLVSLDNNKRIVIPLSTIVFHVGSIRQRDAFRSLLRDY